MGSDVMHDTRPSNSMPTGVVAIVVALILAVAILGASFMFTHKPKPSSSSGGVTPEIACLQGGGSWDMSLRRCNH